MSGVPDGRSGQHPGSTAPPGCTISTHRSGDEYVIVVAGELEHRSAEAVESAVAQAAGAPEVVFELGEVTFVDSAGLRIFIQALRQVQPSGGRVILAEPSTTLRRLLELTGLDQHFVIQS